MSYFSPSFLISCKKPLYIWFQYNLINQQFDCIEYYLLAGKPIKSPPIIVVHKILVASSVIVLFSSLAGVGIFSAIGFLLFNVIHRKNRWETILAITGFYFLANDTILIIVIVNPFSCSIIHDIILIWLCTCHNHACNTKISTLLMIWTNSTKPSTTVTTVMKTLVSR